MPRVAHVTSIQAEQISAFQKAQDRRKMVAEVEKMMNGLNKQLEVINRCTYMLACLCCHFVRTWLCVNSCLSEALCVYNVCVYAYVCVLC